MKCSLSLVDWYTIIAHSPREIWELSAMVEQSETAGSRVRIGKCMTNLDVEEVSQ